VAQHLWRNDLHNNASIVVTCASIKAGKLYGYQPTVEPNTTLLDYYTGSAAAYSLRSLSTSTTNVVKVRRSGDDAELDFTASEVSDGTLAAWVVAGGGTEDGFVTTWYDQSGNVNNATQATAANQPKIVSSGTLVTENGKAALDFDGTNDYISVSGSLYSADINLFSVFKITTTISNYQRILHLADGVNTYQVTRSPQPDNYVLLTKNTEYNTSTFSVDWGIHTGQLLVSTRSNNSTNSDNVYVDSVAQVDGGNNITIGGGNNSPSTFGVRNDLLATSYFDGTLQEIIIYHSDQSANRTGIEDNINAHYNIYT